MSRIKKGKYFIIKTKINPDLVLEVHLDGDEDIVGVSSQIRDWVGNNDHQMWCYDYNYRTLVNKKNNLFLDHSDDKIVVKSLEHRRYEEFVLENNYIKAVKSGLVLEFKGAQCFMKEKSDSNILQIWKIENQPALFFYIKLKSNPNLVVDVKGDDKNAGAKVILYESKGNMADNQLWYEDKQGFLRSKINEFTMDLTDKNEVVLNPYNGQSKQQWTVSGNYIRNAKDPSLILLMKSGNVFTNHRLVAARDSNDMNSQFDVLFIPHQSITLNHMGKGKNFVVRSMLSGLTLEIEDEIIDAGNKVVLGRYHEDPLRVVRQHFYQDKLTGAIRSVLRNFVLEAADDGLKLNPYDPYNKMQMWFIDLNKIRNKHNTSLVLQANKSDNTVIVAEEADNMAEQLWEFYFMPAKCFHIVSVSSNKVLDVRGCNASSGASVILYSKNNPVSDNQLWYEDEMGLVRSKLNGYVFDSSGNDIKVMPFNPDNKEQYWVIVGDRIQNKYEDKMVLDISGESRMSGTPLIKYKFHGGDNQRWKFEYID